MREIKGVFHREGDGEVYDEGDALALAGYNPDNEEAAEMGAETRPPEFTERPEAPKGMDQFVKNQQKGGA